MRVVAVAIAIAALAAFPAAAKLDSSNSILAGYRLVDTASVAGVGCGTAASQTVALPTGIQDPRVVRPKVGDTDGDVRVTAVAIEGAVVRVTAVGDGPLICSPEEDPDVPPAERRWRIAVTVEANYHRRVQVLAWLENRRGTSVRTGARPRKLHIPFRGTLVNIRWKSFGGKKARGTGTWRPELLNGRLCPRRNCPDQGMRTHLELTRPSICADVGGKIYYGREALINTRRVGVLPPGTDFILNEPMCRRGGPFPAKPAPR